MGRLGSFSMGLAWIHSCFCIQLERWLDRKIHLASLISLAVGTGYWLDFLTSPPDLPISSELDGAYCHYGGLSVPRWWMKPEVSWRRRLWNAHNVIFVIFYWSKYIPRIAQRWRTKNKTICSWKEQLYNFANMCEHRDELLISLFYHIPPAELMLQISKATDLQWLWQEMRF